ncbi:zf-HC2 domain-containing protein [Streptomyces sp. NPDC004065]|uniref:zf-HC2 domain-containing protein n=1 Tax=Streptomyces sp. NPDC004065 TaxID=3364689 RepID=UPI00384AF51A
MSPRGPSGEDGARGGHGGPPRIPTPRASVEDGDRPLPPPPPPPPPEPEPPQDATPPGDTEHPQDTAPPEDTEQPKDMEQPKEQPALVPAHDVLKSLLGAWALAACSPRESAAVEEHLGACGGCAEEALRLREAVGLLHPPESLDLDPGLRTRVLESCLERRPPRVPVPEWAAPYDAEAARLDALLQDIADAEWHTPVRLRWFEDEDTVSRRTTVAGVIAHLMSVDGLVAVALGLDDPLGGAAVADPTPAGRTEAYWKAAHFPPSRDVRAPWRAQTHALVRAASLTSGAPDGTTSDGTTSDGGASDGGAGPVSAPGGPVSASRGPVSAGGGPGAGGPVVPYGGCELPLPDAMLDRAFECWVHAEDIAEAVDYPYAPPAPRHLHRMIDLAARTLPGVLAARRLAGLASPARTRRLVAAGEPGRSLRLEIEGLGGGEWLIPLDAPGAVGSAEHEVAHVALDGVEFCRLAAGHVAPRDAAAGQVGDREAIRDVLYAAASLSRM